LLEINLSFHVRSVKNPMTLSITSQDKATRLL
jgi:hypothetical protein